MGYSPWGHKVGQDWAHLHVCACRHAHAHMHAYTHTHSLWHAHAHMHTHTHTHTESLARYFICKVYSAFRVQLFLAPEHESPEDLVNSVGFNKAGIRAQESAFLTSSQVMSVRLDNGPHFPRQQGSDWLKVSPLIRTLFKKKKRHRTGLAPIQHKGTKEPFSSTFHCWSWCLAWGAPPAGLTYRFNHLPHCPFSSQLIYTSITGRSGGRKWNGYPFTLLLLGQL